MKYRIAILCCLQFLLLQSLHASSDLQPFHLTCEYSFNPLGIDVLAPRLGWNFQSRQRGQLQTAYEIVVSDNAAAIANAKGNCWQTGKVISGQNLHVVYAGKKLVPFTRYFWRVKVYDKDGLASDWSTVANFETAALQSTDWQAKWIGDGSQQFEKDEDFYQEDPMPLFRRQLSIRKKLVAARLYIAGLGYAEAFVNGKKLGDHVLDPGFTAYRKQVLYVTHDITALLKAGAANTIGVMLGNGWYNPLPLRLFGRFNLRNVQQTGRPCVKAQVLLQYADGSTATIGTDESWQTAPGPVIKNNVYLGESYDARKEKRFDDAAGWKFASIVSGPGGRLAAQLQPPIRITKVLHPISIRQAGKDTFIADMGQNFAGVARIRVKGAAGRIVVLRYGELLHENGALNWMTTTAGHIKEMWNLGGGPGAPKTAWQQDSYTLKGMGIEEWQPRFTFHGFRYVEITGWPGTPTVNDIEGLRMNSDVDTVGNFSCSNEMFNQLHEKIQWTFLSNLFSVQSDCPAREKMGYGADIVATAGAFCYNYQMANFYRKTIQDFANDQQPDGAFTEIAPYTGIADRGYGGESGPLGWQLAFCYLQKKLYDHYGDEHIIAQQYPAFQRQLAWLQQNAQQGLYFWDIGDHEAIDTRAEAFSAACFYYHHVSLGAAFAGILHRTADSIQYATLADEIRSNIIKRYYVPGTGRFDNATQAAQLFALWYKLSPDVDKSFAVYVQELQRRQGHLSTGIFSTMMMFDVLSEADKNDIAYSIANQKDFPGWGYMLGQGATTLWESWQKPTSSSMNHPMFGSIDQWFYTSLAGIRAAAPGFTKIIIHPQPAGLTWAKGSYQSVQGEIVSEWKKSGEAFQLHASIPPNTTAEIWLPANEKSVITESGQDVSLTAAIQRIKYENGYWVFSVGSGVYDFSVGN